MKLGQDGFTEYVERSDRYELQVGPEEDDDGLLFAVLTPAPHSKDLTGSWSQDYAALIRRAAPTHTEFGEALFLSSRLPALPGCQDPIEQTNPESVLRDLKLGQEVETRRLSDDGTRLRARYIDGGIELIHVGPGEEKYQVGLGLLLDLADMLWADYQNGHWLPVGKSVFPGGDPTILGEHEIV